MYPSGATLYGESLPQEEEADAPVESAPPHGIPRWILAVSGSALLLALLGWWLVARSPEPPEPPSGSPPELVP
jgi:hypothetical protein